MASRHIMQLKANLVGAHIPIWREFQVMDDVKFSRLAYIIMTMFEMEASHLFDFDIDRAIYWKKNKIEYLDPDEVIADLEKRKMRYIKVELPNEWSEGFNRGLLLDASKEKVRRYLEEGGGEMVFTYDFGDNWEVRIVLQDIFDDKDVPGKDLPRVIAGKGYGIIENCGGVGGLEVLDKAFKTKGDGYEEYAEWLGVTSLNLRTFDIDDMNFRLKKVPRIYRDIYEFRLEPTEQSWKILGREYIK